MSSDAAERLSRMVHFVRFRNRNLKHDNKANDNDDNNNNNSFSLPSSPISATPPSSPFSHSRPSSYIDPPSTSDPFDPSSFLSSSSPLSASSDPYWDPSANSRPSSHGQKGLRKSSSRFFQRITDRALGRRRTDSRPEPLKITPHSFVPATFDPQTSTGIATTAGTGAAAEAEARAEFPIVVVQYKRADFGVGDEEELHWMLMILITDTTSPLAGSCHSEELAMTMSGPSFQAIDRHYSDERGVVWNLHYTQTDNLVNMLSKRCLGGVRVGGISFRDMGKESGGVDGEKGNGKEENGEGGGRWKTREELESEVKEVVELIRGHEPVVKQDVEGWNCRAWLLEVLQLLREKQCQGGVRDEGSSGSNKGSKSSKASKASKAKDEEPKERQTESRSRSWVDDGVTLEQKWIVERMRVASRETVKRNALLEELDGEMSVRLVGVEEKTQETIEDERRVGEGRMKYHVPVVVGWGCCDGEGGESEGSEDEGGEDEGKDEGNKGVEEA